MHAAPKLISAVEKTREIWGEIYTHLLSYLCRTVKHLVSNYKELCSPFCLDFLSSVKRLMNDLKPRSWPVPCCRAPEPLLFPLTALSSQHVSAQPSGKCWEVLRVGGVALVGVNRCPPTHRGVSCVMEGQHCQAADILRDLKQIPMKQNTAGLCGCPVACVQFPLCFNTVNYSYITYCTKLAKPLGSRT